MYTVNERLKFLRKTLKLNQQEFSDKIGVSQSALTLMENGKRTIRDIYVTQMCHIFNVNETWLRTGQGEMFMASNTFSLDEQAKKSNLTDLEIRIMQSYMNLDRNIREKLMAELEAIFKPNHDETVATIEDNIEPEIETEVAAFRQELEAEKRGETLLASQKPERRESS